MSSEDPNIKIQRKINLVGYIDHLYRIAFEKPFYFADLVHPTPKKTTHVLKMLLNYLHYVIMVTQEIRETATDAINEYNNKNAEKIKFQVENESKKSASANVSIFIKIIKLNLIFK